MAPDAGDPMLDELAARVAAGDRIVLVHGGGPQIDLELSARGIGSERVAGLRATDAAALEITERVLCASINKALVRALQRRGVAAAGISGQDAALLRARTIAPIDGRSLGFVGEIAEVRPALVRALLEAGITPVVAPVAIAEDASTALNVNADTAAGALAGALGVDAYVVVTNVARVRVDAGDPATEIATLDAPTARRYLTAGNFDGGMRPKIESVLAALDAGAKSAVICGSDAGLAAALNGAGTVIVPEP